MRKTKLRFAHYKDGIEANFARNGRFYGICSIKRCSTKWTAYYIEMLIPGDGDDHGDLCGPFPTIKLAKENARKIVERVVADFQNIELLP